MNTGRRPKRNFLFLQGPPGPFFRLLGAELAYRRCGVHRINLSGGDRYDWSPDSGEAVIDYRGRAKDWPLFFDAYVQDHAITDVVLFGDCRPMHRSALRLAQLRGVHIHVFEEGYIRPDWMTLERDGVNGHSSFERDPEVLFAAARWLPDVPQLPAITATFRRRARDSFWHYFNVFIGKWRFPFYRTHRQDRLVAEALGWLLRFARTGRRARQAEETMAALKGQRYFLFPLQLSGDYQIRAHSPFASMPMAVDYVMRSFARHAPADVVLLIKEHPLDSGFLNWRRHIARRARQLGVADRVLHIDGGNLGELSAQSSGMVCVNSTSGTLGLEVGSPVIVLGDAVYDVPGVTHQASLDSFWQAPELPDPALYKAFKKVLHARCLVRGGLASESAIHTLIANSVERLLADDLGPRLALQAGRQELGTRPASSR
ncbi:capsule biosynthesis protein [Novosphingobium aerophilum]|uniref:Capsular biosynthesis protein n=1 Tax=Novosphingobium aerophilum TaxID=2839843 RepID=A0A7X1F7K9_9SPHN|nr:capsular biosynthesis protein [Novosphingobium aerophilum]MBC2651524.1 capsular biosynthesis protein [Novosphingobium aerophilum]